MMRGWGGMMEGIRIVARIVAALLAFAFAFFGYFKIFASAVVLAQHHAWTTALPAAAGRAVGVSELLAAFALLLGTTRARWYRYAIAGALYLIVNQALAAWVHVDRGETAALTQNAVLAGLALIVLSAGYAERRSVELQNKQARMRHDRSV